VPFFQGYEDIVWGAGDDDTVSVVPHFTKQEFLNAVDFYEGDGQIIITAEGSGGGWYTMTFAGKK